MNHISNFYIFEAKKSREIYSNPDFDDNEVFHVGDMVWVDPNVKNITKMYRNVDPNVQYEVIEVEGYKIWIFDDVNDYIFINNRHLNKAGKDDKNIKWFKNGKLEEK